MLPEIEDFLTKNETKGMIHCIGDINMYRTYHRTDPVPMIAIYPFMQAPINNPGYFLPSDFTLTSGYAHDIKHYISSLDVRLEINIRIPYRAL
jgi:hypothetical protein